MNTDGITITSIEAVNVLKFDRFELRDPGKLTLLRGANDQGKTTVLRLLGLCVRGADDPARVIHDGAAKGALAVGLSNGYTLRRSFTAKGEYFDITDEQGHKVPSPQKFINDWLGEFRDFNPLAWLQLDPKEQVRVLLMAIAAPLTPAEFTAATGFAPPTEIDFSRHGLLVLDDLRAHYADQRKVENALAKQKKGAAQEARATLPAEKPVITEAQRSAAKAAAEEARTTRESLEARRLAATNHAAAVETIDSAIRRTQEDHDRAEVEIARLLAEVDRLRHEQERLKARGTALHAERAALAASAPPTDDEKEAANVKIRHANALATAITEAERMLRSFAEAERLEQEALDAAAQAGVIDSTIKILDGDLRSALMKKAALPVDDLTIEEGRILVGGHELKYIQESLRIRVAVAIARALRPKLRVIVLDGAEQLDAKTFQIFLDEIRGDGFTYLAAEVDRNGGALQVVIFGETENGVVQLEEVA